MDVYCQEFLKKAKEEDRKIIMNIWKEHLENYIKDTLNNKIPEDYDLLKEQRNIGVTHEKLIKMKSKILENNYDDHDFEIIELMNLHKSIFDQILDRRNMIDKCLKWWDIFKKTQMSLIDWIKQFEKEKNSINLKLFSFKSISKILSDVEKLINDEIPVGMDILDHLNDQGNMINECYNNNNELIASIRIETSNFAEKISNSEAILKVWQSLLIKLSNFANDYNSQYTSLCQLLENSTEHLYNQKPILEINFENIKQNLATCHEIVQNLETINGHVINYLAPHDMKMMLQDLSGKKQILNDLNNRYDTLNFELNNYHDILENFQKNQIIFLENLEDYQLNYDNIVNFDNYTMNEDILNLKISSLEKQYSNLENNSEILSINFDNNNDNSRNFKQSWLKFLEQTEIQKEKIKSFLNLIKHIVDLIDKYSKTFKDFDQEISKPVMIKNLSNALIKNNDILNRLSSESFILDLLKSKTDLSNNELFDKFDHPNVKILTEQIQQILIKIENYEQLFKKRQNDINTLEVTCNEIYRLNDDIEKRLNEKRLLIEQCEEGYENVFEQKLFEKLLNLLRECYHDFNNESYGDFDKFYEMFSGFLRNRLLNFGFDHDFEELNKHSQSLIRSWDHTKSYVLKLIQKFDKKLATFKDFLITHENAVSNLKQIQKRIGQENMSQLDTIKVGLFSKIFF